MTAALEGGEWSAARPGRTLPPERPGTHFTGDWVGLRAGLDGRGKARPHRDSIPDRPARSSVAIPTELPDPINFLSIINQSRTHYVTFHCILILCTITIIVD